MMTRTELIACALMGALSLGTAAAQPQADAALFDASRLKTGVFTYRDTVNGKAGNLSTSTISPLSDGNYRFTADIPGFDQSWSTVATRSMSPLQTTLKMRTRDGRHYQMNLSYSGSHVSGEAVTGASSDGKLPGSDQSVAAEIPDQTPWISGWIGPR